MANYGPVLGAGGVSLLGQFIKDPNASPATKGTGVAIPKVFIGTLVAAIFVAVMPEQVGNPMAYLILVGSLFLYGPGIFKGLGLTK